jgi:purine-binding chemotaxis protein CheW
MGTESRDPLLKGRAMNRPIPLVVFRLDENRYALYLGAVERVVRAAEITGLPQAPPVVSGVLNVRGRVLVVFDPRKRFRLAEREMEPGDHLVIARSSKRDVVLIADEVLGVSEVEDDRLVEKSALPLDFEYVAGVAKLEDGLILIHDLDSFLSLDENRALDDALREFRE